MKHKTLRTDEHSQLLMTWKKRMKALELAELDDGLAHDEALDLIPGTPEH